MSERGERLQEMPVDAAVARVVQMDGLSGMVRRRAVADLRPATDPYAKLHKSKRPDKQYIFIVLYLEVLTRRKLYK